MKQVGDTPLLSSLIALSLLSTRLNSKAKKTKSKNVVCFFLMAKCLFNYVLFFLMCEKNVFFKIILYFPLSKVYFIC